MSRRRQQEAAAAPEGAAAPEAAAAPERRKWRTGRQQRQGSGTATTVLGSHSDLTGMHSFYECFSCICVSLSRALQSSQQTCLIAPSVGAQVRVPLSPWAVGARRSAALAFPLLPYYSSTILQNLHPYSLTPQDAPLSSPPHGVLDPFSRATTGTDTPQRAENRCRRCRRIHPAITSFQHYFRPSICLIAFHPSVLTSHPWCSFSLPPSLQHPRPLLHVLNPSAFPPRLTGAELPPRVGCLESPQEILQVSPPNPRDIVSNQLRTSMPERDVLH